MAFTRRIFTKEFRLNAAKLVVDEHRLSSAMTFFQGKRNETFPERFTIVS